MEMTKLDICYEPVFSELRVLKKQHRGLEQDIEEDVEHKRPKFSQKPSVTFFERAYTSAIVCRVMGASKQKGKKFDHSSFRRSVVEYLEADKDPTGNGRSPHGDELTHLFGVGEVVLSDPRNAVTLHKVLERGLDNGTIVIIPIPPTNTETMKWKCVLVNEAAAKNMVLTFGDIILRWRDYDGKELQFRGDNRPARRYLYFRFIITYLHAKKDGNLSWVDKVDNRHVMWASPGLYLEKSTLTTLARNISGFELPSHLYEKNTFEADEAGNPEDDGLLALWLRNAMVFSSKNEPGDEADTDEEDL
ncbi:hypothetical protein AJ79_04421 [Helicocarpus griseus UAMH5409]|uniref:HNH nuclease domain-containing protein n=1 Tax=Helicocarpus griseus UAMH5409 TaxID=1447875 RepID=A0A2B7XTZ6_9EURO|nr:hypothetical protein AJ79_04421 [Helicocarpus griseus UAMH5409]